MSEGVWQQVDDFRDRWAIKRRAKSGGQGNGFIVHLKGENDAAEYFCKELKDQTNSTRRVRMYREAVGLETYDHPRIPKLVESNARSYETKAAKLYVVMEYVSGKTLLSRCNEPLLLADAVAVTDQLADTVEYLHANGAVHRDIKPENVILRNGSIDAVLVDFGLTFNHADSATDLTRDGEELGNRFLRIPELASYSEGKQDSRTDIAFLTGILFFCVTGKQPAILEDANGRLPHQRSDVDLSGVSPELAQVRSLRRLFDRGFRTRLDDRFPTIQAFRGALSDILKPANLKPDYLEMLTRAGRLGGDGESAARYRRRSSALEGVWRWMDKNVRAIQVLTRGVYVVTSSGDYEPGTDHPYRNIGLHHHHRGARNRYWLKTTCNFVGPELVVTVAEEDGSDEEEVLRTPIEDPNFDDASDDVIQTRLVIGLEDLPPP